MNAKQFCQTTKSFLASLALALLAACGGSYGSGGSGGMGTCGGGYAGGSCTPSVSVTTVSGTVSGMVTLTANASAKGSYTVANVQFKVDGTAVGAPDTSAPYSYDWNSTTVADGVHHITAVVTDSSNQQSTSGAVAVTVSNGGAMVFAVTLSADPLFPKPVTTATGTGNFSADDGSPEFTGNIVLTGVTPTSAEIGDAYAGSESAPVFTLTANASTANQWDVPSNSTLSAQQLADLQAGKFYVLVRSAQFPNGELRAQLLPAGIVVKFAPLTGAAEVPPVTSAATGQVAVTVDAANLRAAAHINVAGMTATGAEMAAGATGSVGTTLTALAVDASNSNHYFNDAITLTSADVTSFNDGHWYGNVSSAAHPGGELRGQVNVAESAAPTLTQLQADIFSPICSGCHNGTGASLPGIQNLTAGHTYASLVNVTSIENPALKRILPGDPDNSYLVLKIQGSPGISGQQMPLTGGPLSQAQIDEVRAWVAAGALNN